ncbi:MAG: hypothetical protein ABIT37_07310 [Luteolibacter sp.]
MAQRISIEVTPAIVTQAKTKLADLREVFADLLVALPPDDAKKLFKIGLQRRGLPDHGLACADANPDILPGTFKIAEQRKDVESARNLLVIEGLLEQFLKEIRDTRTLCEADGADWALRVYRHAGDALADSPGIKVWVDTLGQYFEQSSRSETPAPPKP